MDVTSLETSDGSTNVSTSTALASNTSDGQEEQGQASASANNPSTYSTSHGQTAHRSPSASSYASFASVASSKKTRSLRPPTWRGGSGKSGKTASASQLRTSSSGSFEASAKAKAVTSASEPSVSLVNAESFPSFNSDDALDQSYQTSTARPRDRRGRVDSSASVTSLSMYITNTPNWTGTVEGKGKGKMTYGHSSAGTGRGEGGRNLMSLFEDEDGQAPGPSTTHERSPTIPEPLPLTTSNSTGSDNSNVSAASDTPTVTLSSTGPVENSGRADSAAALQPNTSTNSSYQNLTTTPMINDASESTTDRSHASEPVDLSEPDDNSTATNQAQANPVASSNFNATKDNPSDNDVLSPTPTTTPLNVVSTSSSAVDVSHTQGEVANAVDHNSMTLADTSAGEPASSSMSWFGSLGRAMGNRTQANPDEARGDKSETERRVRAVQDHLKESYSSSLPDSNNAVADQPSMQNGDVGSETGTSTVRERTRGTGTVDYSAKPRPKTWFFSPSHSPALAPTPPEAETTSISGSATIVAGDGNRDAVSVLIASTSRAQSLSRSSSDRAVVPPPSASTTGSTSFPPSPLTSSSIPSSIDDEVPVPKLMLSEVTVSPEELEEMSQMLGGIEDPVSLGLGTIKPRPFQRLGVVSMHRRMDLEEQALVGTIKGNSSGEFNGIVNGNVFNGSEAAQQSRDEEASATGRNDEVGQDKVTASTSDGRTSSPSTPRLSPRPPRQRINSINSLNPSTSRFSIVGIPLSFWRAPDTGSGGSEEDAKKKSTGMDTKSHADTSTITSSADTTSSATNTTTASSTTSANITDITANPATTSISTPSRSKSPSPIPSTLSSKSGPVTSLSTDTVTVAANSNDGTDAKGQLTRAGSTSAGGEAPIREESREEGGMVEETRQEDQMWVNGTQSSEESTVAATTSHDTQETTQQENPTYTGSWWDYVGWGSSSATTRNESVPASGATDGNVVEDTVEGVKQDDSATESDHTVPSTEPSNAAISSDTVTLPPATAPAQSHASQVEPSPPEAEVSSTTGMKSAPPTVLAEDSKPPPRAASVFSGETVRSGAGSWLAPWTWYGGSGTSAPPTAAASSISVDIDKEPKLKRQMTESERVKEEALARDRGRENEAGAEAEAEKDGEPEQQPRLEQEETKDVGPSEEHAISSLPPAEQSASSPPATAEESASASLTSTPPTSSGWASFFSIGKGKGTSVKQIQDGSDDSQVKRDENGMEIMDLDEDEASAGDAQAGAISESKIDASSKAIPIQSKEVVKKESMKEILKAGATSPERKVSLVKALLQPSSSPKPASILSSLSSSPSKHPISGLPTKASATSDQDNITSASVSKDQIGISSRGRTDSMITTATSTSKASSVAKRAPLLVVSDDVKAKAATKAARSSSRGKEKEKDGSASGGEISDGKEKKEKSEKTKTKVEKKDSVKENDKDKKKDDKDKKHSKSNSGSSTPVPPAPPNLVLPTWADTFYTPPRSRLPSGVLPLTPLPGTEAYEAMYAKDEQKGLGSTLGRTMKYVSGVLFSGDRSNVERKKTSSLFGNASASGSDTTSKRGSESSMPVSGAGRRGSAASASSLPMSGGLVSPRIAALRAGSSSGRVGGSMKVGSAQAQTSKGRDVNIELMKEKERLYWDWGRSLPRSWEVVQFGQPIGLEQDDTDGVQEAGEDLKPEKAKAEEIDRDVSRSGQASSRSQGLIPGMGLEPGTTLSLPAHVLTNYKNKGKGREQALPEASAVEDVLKGCKKVVVIGIHGWFPGAVMRSVFGEPTGTSLKFVNMMVQALEVFQEKHGVRLEKITKIPLEGEGTIDRRVEKLYTNLVSNEEWMDDLHNTDVIFVATHSQGSVVSTHLLDRLIRERHIRTSKNGTTEPIADLGVNMVPLPPQRVCCLALCGIHLGPLRYLSTSSLVQPYIQYFESAAARELFEFQNTENEVSKSYVKALHNVVDNGTKMVYVASLNDQVVPIYSGLFTAASHPLILRALYIDGDAYNSSDFLSNLLVLLLRVLNTGLSDSGLLAHLSEVTAGSLNGVGHSTAYEELATYSLAVDYLFLANDGFDEHPELTFEPFNAASEMNDYEIPWALRDLIADERVAHFFSREITDLRDAFRDWNPKTSILRDIKRKLQPIQRLPSTLAPGSANSNSKL